MRVQGRLHVRPDVARELAISCPKPVLVAGLDPEEREIGDDAVPPGRDVRAQEGRLRSRSRHEAKAALGERLGAEQVGGETRAAVRISDPEDLLECGAVDIGIFHAGNDGAATHLPDLVQPCIARPEVADSRHGEMTLDHLEVMKTDRGISKVAERQLKMTETATRRRGVLLATRTGGVAECIVEPQGIFPMLATQVFESVDINDRAGWSFDLERDEAGELATEIEYQFGITVRTVRNRDAVARDDRLQFGWNRGLVTLARMDGEPIEVDRTDECSWNRSQEITEAEQAGCIPDCLGECRDVFRNRWDGWEYEFDRAHSDARDRPDRDEGRVGVRSGKRRHQRDRARSIGIDEQAERVPMILAGDTDDDQVIATVERKRQAV